MTLRKQIVLLTTLGLVVGFISFCYFYPLFYVTGYRIIIDGAEREVDIDSLFGAEREINLFRQPLRSYAETLLRGMPELSSVTCRINLSGEVVCKGVPKRPIVLVCLPEVYGLSEQGDILPLSSCDKMSDLPLISGIHLKNVRPFYPVSSPKLLEALEICRLIRKRFPDLSDAISQIDFKPDEAPVLYFRNSDVTVIVGRGNYKEKLSRLALVLDRLDRLPAHELDLRFGISIVARKLV